MWFLLNNSYNLPTHYYFIVPLKFGKYSNTLYLVHLYIFVVLKHNLNTDRRCYKLLTLFFRNRRNVLISLVPSGAGFISSGYMLVYTRLGLQFACTCTFRRIMPPSFKKYLRCLIWKDPARSTNDHAACCMNCMNT